MQLAVADSSTRLDFQPTRVIIAGFTGRDSEAVEQHLSELRQHGVIVPDSFPVFYPIPPELLTADSTIAVTGTESSGEVEPVLLFCGGAWYVTVGSDHTPRDVERIDIAMSKAASPKIVSTLVWRYDDVIPHWDDLVIQSWALDGGRSAYQEGSLANLLPVTSIIERALDGHGPDGDTAIFLGTVPLLDGEFLYAPGYEIRLHDPRLHRELRCTYAVIPNQDSATAPDVAFGEEA